MDSFSLKKTNAESALCDAAEIQRLKRFTIWETSFGSIEGALAIDAEEDFTEQTIQSKTLTED